MVTSADRTTAGREPSAAAQGTIAVAAVLMIIAGVCHIAQGLIALFNDAFYVVGAEYLFSFDTTTWGWVHLLAGVLVVFGGAALFRGAGWARALAVVLASLSIVANFLWLPYYPLWAAVIIVFDIVVIWAVLAHGRELAQM